MTRNIRIAAVHLALAALILRAFLPAGWMPNPNGPSETAFVICSMDGPVFGADGKTQPGKVDPRAHESCPFAAAAQPAPATEVVALVPPILHVVSLRDQSGHDVESRFAALSPQSPRGPPSFT
jgi:hypothetical protein